MNTSKTKKNVYFALFIVAAVTVLVTAVVCRRARSLGERC